MLEEKSAQNSLVVHHRDTTLIVVHCKLFGINALRNEECLSKSGKKKLLCYIIHAPLFESCFPLLERLNERGKIEVDLVIGARLPRTDPGIASAYRNRVCASGIKPVCG